PLRPGLRVAGGGAVGDVLAGACEAASWGAADTQIRRPRGQGDGILPLADGGRDPLHVADDAGRIAGGDLPQLNWTLAARSLSPPGLDLVEPRGIGMLGKKRAVDTGQDGHGGILARRSLGAGE